MFCICCEQNIIYPSQINDNFIPPENEEKMLWTKEIRSDGTRRSVESFMILNGIINIVDAGYGSKFDGDSIIIAICDDCIREKLESATLLYYENYMGWGGQEDIEKSKSLYRRRKSLDDLVK